MRPVAKLVLYENPHQIHVHLTDYGVANYNSPMNRNDFILVQGADSSIELVVRNNDRKPVNLAGRNIDFVMVDPRTGELVMSKPCLVFDPRGGRCRVRFAPTDIIDVAPGFYSYSILCSHHDGRQELLLTDLNQAVKGSIEVRAGILPQIQRSIEILTDPLSKLTPVDVFDPPQTQWRTSAFPGDSQSQNGDALHTIAIYASNYTGRIWVQGSLLDEPTQTDTDWFTIDPGTGGPIGFQRHTGLDAFNFLANCMWVRFILQPDPLNEGFVEKILLKN